MQRPLYSPLHWGAEIAGVIILLSLISYVALQWGDLPEKIPTHYNFSGQADAWGSKSALLYLPGAALLVWILLTVVSFSLRFGIIRSKSPPRTPNSFTAAA